MTLLVTSQHSDHLGTTSSVVKRETYKDGDSKKK